MLAGLELSHAEEFLRNHLGAKVTAFERLHGGDWSQAFGFRADGRDLVARFGSHVDDFEKDRAAMAISGPGLPVPKVFEIGPAFGGHFCISERLYGEMLEDLDASAMRRIVPAVFRLLDAMRLADTNAWTDQVGAPIVSWTEQLLRVDEETDRVCGWHDKMAVSASGAESYREGLGYLRSHIGSCPQDRHMLHNDLLHGNVLVRQDSIAGVIDWGCASLGDFLYDLGLFTFYTPWFPHMAGIDWAAKARAHYAEIGLEVPNFEERLRCYEVHLGLAGMAYCSFISDFGELKAHSDRLMHLIR